MPESGANRECPRGRGRGSEAPVTDRRDPVGAFGRIARERFGLAQPARNLATLEQRLGEAMQRAGFDGPAELFVRRLERAPEGSALARAATEALTNQETCFFRECEQLRGLGHELVPRMCGQRPGHEPLRILSAGCSTGEEAYSVAMLLLEELHLLWGRRLEVVGVDLCEAALEQARAGRYPASALTRAGQGPAGWESRFFRREGESLVAREFLKAVTSFERANLVAADTLETLGRFDVIVCRNVFIYFDQRSVERALDALSRVLRPGGAMVLGHAEAGMATPLQGRLQRAPRLLWFAGAEGPG